MKSNKKRNWSSIFEYVEVVWRFWFARTIKVHPKSAGTRIFLHCASEILHNPSKSIWMKSAIQSRQPHPSFERPKRCSCINSLERIPLGPPQRLYALTPSSNWRERCSSCQSFNPLANLLEGLIWFSRWGLMNPLSHACGAGTGCMDFCKNALENKDEAKVQQTLRNPRSFSLRDWGEKKS